MTAIAVLVEGGCSPPKSLSTEVGTATLVDTWQAMTGDVFDEDLVAAAVAYCRRPGGDSFWPRLGMVLGMLPGRNVEDDADLAWGELLGFVRRHGSYNPPGEGRWLLDRDPARAEAIGRGIAAVGGWKAVCALEVDGVAAARASFRAAYRATRQRTATAIEGRAVRELMASRGLDVRQIGVDPFADKPPQPLPQPVGVRRDDDADDDE